SHHPNERIRAVILDVRKVGQRVKIILSRTHPDFVRRLFELEIPELAHQTTSIRGPAREAGYGSKAAVRSTTSKVTAAAAGGSAAPGSRTSSTSWAGNGSTSSAGMNRSRS